MNVGGAQKVVLDYARSIDKDTFELHIVIFFVEAPHYLEELESAGVNIHHISVSNNLLMLLSYARLRSLIESLQPQLVHAHLPLSAVFLAMATRNMPIIRLYTDHSIFCHYHLFTRRLFQWLKIGNSFDRILAVSRASADSLQATNRLAENQLQIVHNGVDTDYFQSTTTYSSSLPLDLNELLIGTLTTFRTPKRLDLWIKLASSLHQRYPGMRFMIVGNKSEKGKIRDLVSNLGGDDFIEVLDIDKNSKPYYEKMDIYLSTSDYEGFGLSLAEAMSMQKLVIARPAGGNLDLIEHGEDGYLFSFTENIEQMRNEFITFFNNINPDIRMNARKKVVREFNLSVQSSKLTNFYKELIENQHKNQH
ncbi:MAG: glycosyltransferase [Cyclobacteriaceae bacterium]|nr:glycosyltransferase [Cyclobacteriaceae bacterium]